MQRKQNVATNGHSGEGGEEQDVHMRQSRGPRSRKRRRGQDDVEMMDAEVCLCTTLARTEQSSSLLL